MTMWTAAARRWAQALVALGAGAAAVAPAAAQTNYEWVGPVSGEWGAFQNWLPADTGRPSQPGDEALIAAGGAYVVTVTGQFSFDLLQLASTEAMLVGNPGSSSNRLSVTGRATFQRGQLGGNLEIVCDEVDVNGDLVVKRSGNVLSPASGVGQPILDVFQGSSVLIDADGQDDAVLTVLSPVISSGDLELANTGGSDADAVLETDYTQVSPGTLIFSGSPGATGRMTIAGLLTVEGGQAQVVASPFEPVTALLRDGLTLTGGSLEVEAGGKLQVGDGGNAAPTTVTGGAWVNAGEVDVGRSLFTMQGGALQNDGLFVVPRGSMAFTGGVITGAQPILLDRSELQNGPMGAGAVTFRTLQLGSPERGQMTGDMPEERIVNIDASGDVATRVDLLSPVVLDGQLALTKSTAGTAAPVLGADPFALGSTLTINSSGDLRSTGASPAVRRELRVPVVSDGDIEVQADLQLFSDLTNRGLLRVDPGVTLHQLNTTVTRQEGLTASLINQGTVSVNTGTFVMDGGTLQNSGVFRVQNSLSLFDFQSGDVLGNAVVLIGGALRLGVGASDGAFTFRGPVGNSLQASLINSVQSVTLEGNDTNLNCAVTCDQAINVSGDLTLTNVGAVSRNVTFTVNGNPLTVNTGGVVDIPLGAAAGARTLTAQLQVNGTLQSARPATVGRAGTAAGVGAGGLILALADLTVNGSSLTVASGGALSARASSASGALVTLPATVTNSGRVELTSDAPGGVGNVTLTNSGTLVNQPSGQVQTLVGAAVGQRRLSLSLDNRGLLQTDVATTLGIAGKTHVNSGLFRLNQALTVQGASFVNQPGGRIQGVGPISVSAVTGSTLVNQGTVDPGTGTGTLTVTGSYAQSATGALRVEIAGADPGDFDVLSVTGPVALDGTLSVQMLGGFKPQVGDTFTILTGNAVTGTFANAPNTVPAAAGFVFTVDYEPNMVILRNFRPTGGPVSPPGDVNADEDVTALDLAICLSEFGRVSGTLQADITNDGAVNQDDLDIVLADFGN